MRTAGKSQQPWTDWRLSDTFSATGYTTALAPTTSNHSVIKKNIINTTLVSCAFPVSSCLALLHPLDLLGRNAGKIHPFIGNWDNSQKETPSESLDECCCEQVEVCCLAPMWALYDALMGSAAWTLPIWDNELISAITMTWLKHDFV